MNKLKRRTLKKMVRLIAKSTGLQREIGAALCEVKGKIELGRSTVGKRSSVKMSKIPKCKVGKQIGTFHTHPRGPSVPTPIDQRIFLRRVWRSESKLMCVGSPSRKESIITCIEPTKDELTVRIKKVYKRK